MKNVLYFMLKALLFSRYLNFCPDFFGHVETWLDKKAKVIFIIYIVTDWQTINSNTYIAQYLMK